MKRERRMIDINSVYPPFARIVLASMLRYLPSPLDTTIIISWSDPWLLVGGFSSIFFLRSLQGFIGKHTITPLYTRVYGMERMTLAPLS